jgi:acetyl esterase/lipase
MKHRLLAQILLLLTAALACSQTTNTNTFPLWPAGAPDALGAEAKDIPTLSVFPAPKEKATGAAMLICPGGGYAGLASHEGADYARFLNEYGITGFVLKYRLGSSGYRHPAMLHDAARAMRTIRARAVEWDVDKNRIGVMGSSAGGHLASTLLTHFDGGRPASPDPIEQESSRPNVGILCYAVITMLEHTHAGSKQNLLGADPPPALLQTLSNELQVTKDTPPCFIWHTWDDKTVAVENSLQFAAALRKAGVLFDLHIYEHGPHGMGLGSGHEWNPAKRHPWTADLVFWLKQHGFAK